MKSSPTDLDGLSEQPRFVKMQNSDKPLTYCFDIDGTLCTNTWGEYEKAEPMPDMIRQVNALYDGGNKIILFTARGTTTGMDWRATTEEQLKKWGVRYQELLFGKPQADLYIDDRGMSLEEWALKRPRAAHPTGTTSGLDRG